MSDGVAPPKPVEEDQVQSDLNTAEDKAEQIQSNGSTEPKDTEPKDTEPKETESVKAQDGKEEEEKANSDSKPASNMLKTTAKTDYENHRSNRKFDPTTREVTDDPDSIRKQVRRQPSRRQDT
jgi:lupus La protein